MMGIARVAKPGEGESGGREPKPSGPPSPRSQRSAAPVVDQHAIDRALNPRKTITRRRVDVGEPVAEATGRPRPLAAATQDIPLEPREIFVLSFVDGHLDASEISDIVGLPRETVDAILDRLALFGCIALD